jgi:hypothetical protein
MMVATVFCRHGSKLVKNLPFIMPVLGGKNRVTAARTTRSVRAPAALPAARCQDAAAYTPVFFLLILVLEIQTRSDGNE